MDETGPAGERPSIWYTYVVGIGALAIVAVLLPTDSSRGSPHAAAATLVAFLGCAVAFARTPPGTGELTTRTLAAATIVVALCVSAVWLAPAAVMAIPALYPVVLSLLPLAPALTLVAAANIAPLAIELIAPRFFNLPLVAVATLVAMIASAVTGTTFNIIVRQRAELAQLSRTAGAADERQRLAREIHDTLAQGFTSIIALAQAIDAELDTNPVAARKHLELISSSAQENLAEARMMVENSTPDALRDDVLVGALRRVCDRFMTETGIATTIWIDPALTALGTAVDVALLRVTQEALANVRKHAQARAVRVELRSTPTHIRLLIIDNGIGISADQAEGFGLRGMRSRLTAIGGELTISAQPDGGTRLYVEVTR